MEADQIHSQMLDVYSMHFCRLASFCKAYSLIVQEYTKSWIWDLFEIICIC